MLGAIDLAVPRYRRGLNYGERKGQKLLGIKLRKL